MAYRADIFIDQGANVAVSFSITDSNGDALNLTNYEKRASMRKHYTSTNAISFTANTGNNVAGEILLTLTADESSNVEAGRYVYDVEIIDENGGVVRVVEGICTCAPEVTR